METTMMRVKAIDATYYTTKDLTKSTKFYTELLGMEPTMQVPDVVSEWTFPGGESFGLYQTTENWMASGGVMFAVDDAEAFVKAAMARGVKFADGGKIEDTPGCHMAFGED
jgi:catechol 2,3-dioxygenase-like lactoylglutathione lyase family enzyme